MRQIKLECTDQGKINQFFKTTKTGYLGLADGKMPYVIPLNFVWLNNSIYFHGAAEGRKVNILEKNANACFTISEDQGTLTDPVPAKTDTAYMSVVLFGEVKKVLDLDEAVYVMQKMLDKYVPGYYDKALEKTHVEKYRSSLGSHTAVFKLSVNEMTAKENPVQISRLFYPGKMMKNDISN